MFEAIDVNIGSTARNRSWPATVASTRNLRGIGEKIAMRELRQLSVPVVPPVGENSRLVGIGFNGRWRAGA